jgi:tetratricopeptide (TPR) repeat protein
MIFKALRERFRPAAADDAGSPKRDPTKAAALSAEASRLAASGCTEEAADHYALAIAHDAELAGAWLGYGRLMRERNEIDAAIAHLQTAARLAPGSAAAWIELARAFKQAARTQDAARAYERAIEADPQEPAGYVNFGLLCLAQLGNPSRAEVLLRQAVALAPESV